MPRADLPDVIKELRQWVDTHDEKVSFPFEVRVLKADDIWLSPAYERDVAYVAFHQYHRMSHERWFSICEDVLGAAGGRPHWGKMHRLTASDFAQKIPRFEDFVALRDELDPMGIFSPYLDRVLVQRSTPLGRVRPREGSTSLWHACHWQNDGSSLSTLRSQ